MFTGLIESIGEIRELNDTGKFRQILVSVPNGTRDLAEGSSIAVNGVCITVTGLSADTFSADLSRETLACTTLGELRAGHHVNLEPALRADARLGGHIVQGHVDGVGRIVSFERQGDDWDLRIEVDSVHRTRLVQKGSVAVDGISLTVAQLDASQFSAAIIPFTLEHTTLQYARAGDRVNLEFDILAKYVERLVEPYLHRIEDALR